MVTSSDRARHQVIPNAAPCDRGPQAASVGQKLYRVYDELLRERGVTSAQVLLTFFDMSARTHYLNARQTLRRLLDWSVVPVINENDTTTTDEISFGDNDFLAAQVAILIGADLLVLLTDIDGLFTADPRIDSSARLVRSRRLRGARGHRHGHTIAAGSAAALEGRRGRDGDGGGHPGGHLQRARRRARRTSWAAPRHALPAQQARYCPSGGCATLPSHGTVIPAPPVPCAIAARRCSRGDRRRRG